MTQTEKRNEPIEEIVEPPIGDNPWVKVAKASAVMVVVWAGLLHIVAQVIIPPVIVIGLIGLAFASSLRTIRRKTALGYALFSVLSVVGNLPGVIGDLSDISSTPAFSLTLLHSLVAALGMVGGLGMFFGWSGQPIRALVSGAATLFGVLIVASMVVAWQTDSAAALDGDVAIAMERVQFVPGEVRVVSGGALWVNNQDGIRHTFTVAELGLDLEIPANKAGRVEVQGPAGTYDVICTVPGHENMVATLEIGQ